MFNFIQKFLKLESFKVKFNETLSNTRVQTEGIPQGSVLTSKFFILKLNQIVAQVPNEHEFQRSFYMDNLQISYRHPIVRVVERELKTA